MISRLVGICLKKGKALFYRGVEYVAGFMTKINVEGIVADGLVDKVVQTIRKIEGADRKGDCRICILPIIKAL